MASSRKAPETQQIIVFFGNGGMLKLCSHCISLSFKRSSSNIAFHVSKICLLILSKWADAHVPQLVLFLAVLQSRRTESVWREEREAELAEKRRAKEMKTFGARAVGMLFSIGPYPTGLDC